MIIILINKNKTLINSEIERKFLTLLLRKFKGGKTEIAELLIRVFLLILGK